MNGEGPVFVPSRKRQRQRQNQQSSSSLGGDALSSSILRPRQRQRQQQPRFHGAFTGGFSAGYFNTVGSREGWKPSEGKTAKDFKVEDFMDEQDHEEWGGPTTVRNEYSFSASQALPGSLKQALDGGNDSLRSEASTALIVPQNKLILSSESASLNSKADVALDRLFQGVRSKAVGPRLLRRLGWREGGTSAFVPENDKNNRQAILKSNNEEEIAFLSSKKLRKIHLQQSRAKLPPPKLDHCGLGFDPYKNAPEFQKHREQRQKLARERARGQRDVYRASLLTESGSGAEGRTNEQRTSEGDQDKAYVSYETMEDFIGSKNVGGFALHDDADDAYDDTPLSSSSKNVRISRDEYNTEVYEHSSDEENHAVPNRASKLNPSLGTISDLFGAFSKTSNGKDDLAGPVLASDGTPILSGFSLGGTVQTYKQRFPGPDVPSDYQLQPHKFGENENPIVYQVLSRAEQLQSMDNRRRSALDDIVSGVNAEPSVASVAPPPISKSTTVNIATAPMAGTHYSALANAMKSRFVSESSNAETTEHHTSDVDVGLRRSSQHLPPTVTVALQTARPSAQTRQSTRTTVTFVPHPLLCKRFRVPQPQNAAQSTNENENQRLSEATYFEQHVLPLSFTTHETITSAQPPSASSTIKKSATAATATAVFQPPSNVPSQRQIVRPDLRILKSIFEPQSDHDGESSTDLSDVVDEDEDGNNGMIKQYQQLDEPESPMISTAVDPSKLQMVVHDQDGNDTERRGGSQDNDRNSHKRHKKRSRSSSSERSSPSGDDDSRRRHKRNKKHKRHKSSSSSRRKHDRDRKRKKESKSRKGSRR